MPRELPVNSEDPVYFEGCTVNSEGCPVNSEGLFVSLVVESASAAVVVEGSR